MIAKLLCKHDDDCCALDGVKRWGWSTPWYLSGKRQFYADKRGGATGHGTRWFVVECNDPECRAEFIVRADALELAATGFLLGGSAVA